ncbi:hypothetical protein [Vannielia litorea]|uniref:hypothetical protein n=1 Tax=Vannielia litorea TaxID=1217970 RepID=UPI00111533E2|nr:hypothetical protein [Vannielia litorea]
MRGKSTIVAANVYSAAVGGAPTSIWNFRFLQYVQGAVTNCRFDQPVLTGPLSGCWCFTYMRGAQRRVAHVGTLVSPDSAESIKVKKAWSSRIAKNPADPNTGITQVMGNNAAQVMGDAETHVLHGQIGGSPYDIKVCAYFENNQAWSILTCREGGRTKIVKAKPMPLVTWQRAQQVLTFA